MNRLISIIDEHDLTDFETVQRFIFHRDRKETKTFADAIEAAIRSDAHSRAAEVRSASIDGANFLPSCSLRGDAGCMHWNCRMPKVRTLARYAALYSDKAIVPVRIQFSGKHSDHSSEFLDRFHLGSILLGIIELRPLIEAGIIMLIPEQLSLCSEHWDEAVPEHRRIARTARKLANENISRFHVTYTPPTGPRGHPGFNFRGPQEYLDHGSIHTVLESPPNWLGKRKARGHPIELSQAAIRRQKLVLRFFWRMANDAFLQTYFGSAFNARYVTDLEGEAEFFKLLHERDELARQTAALCARLTHSVPLFMEAPVSTVLRLRREEPEAFQSYRTALTGIVKKYVKGKSISDSEARDLYLDLLKPELDALQAKATNVRRGQLRIGVLKVAAASALIGVGIYSGVLPSHLTDLVKTIGGFSVAKDLAETLAAAQKNPTEIRNHNLYFLLRLRQQRA
jgi:hypothetical protein